MDEDRVRKGLITSKTLVDELNNYVLYAKLSTDRPFHVEWSLWLVDPSTVILPENEHVRLIEKHPSWGGLRSPRGAT